MRPITWKPLALVLALSLPGCAGLATINAAVTPADLYELTPKNSFDPDLPSVSAQIVVEEPTAGGGLNTDRIAVKPNPYLLQYFPQSRWVERAPLMVQTLLVESIENTGRVRAVGRRAIGITSDFTILTDLREFQALVPEGEPEALVAQVRLNMKIIEEPRGIIIASASFGAEERTASREMFDVAAAFDAALGRAMRSSVEWAVRELAEARPRY
jgi:cholesterol transport system auxiliary component